MQPYIVESQIIAQRVDVHFTDALRIIARLAQFPSQRVADDYYWWLKQQDVYKRQTRFSFLGADGAPAHFRGHCRTVAAPPPGGKTR